VLNESTKALVHAESEDALLKKICEIATETGKYKLAWVGYAEYDLLKRVVPVAHSGYESGYLEKLNVTWADTERGRGPTGTAIRTGKHCVTRDIHSDPRFQPWREEAEKRGFASVISVPLISGGKVFGVMNMYAQEPGAFDEEEIKLLENLAEELSYGIMSIRARAEHSGLTEMLRTSEEKYRTIIEYAYDAIIAADTETGIVLELNKKAEEMVGLPADRIIGMHQTELHPEELRETSKKQFGEYGEGKRNLSDEVILNRKDGRRIPVEISGNVINHGGRRVTYGILRDISQKLESEKAIRESADKYRRLVENSPDIVYRFSNLDFGTFYSPRVLDILGYTPEYLIERPKLWNESIHPEDKRIAEEAVKGLGDGKGFDIEYRIRNARGEWLWFRDRCISILSKDGYSEIEGMATDITERKKAERKIRESEEQYRRLVENSPDIVYRYSHKNAGIFFSSRVKDILGYTPEYLLEHKSLWDDSIHPDDKLKVANAITDMNGFDIEYRIRDAKGGWRWFSDRSISIVAESGDVIVEGLVTDITRRKATEEKLRLSEQKSKAILSTVGEGVISFGEDFGIRFVNRELCGMFGYTEEELLGKRIGMLFPERAGEKDVPGFEKYFAKGKQEKIGKWIEMDGMRKDESAIPVEMRIEETVVDSNDRFFTMAVHDITERRLAWQEEERRARQIIKNQKTLIELAKIDSTDFNMMLHTLTEASSDTLNVARASIWSYRNDYSELVCMDSYDRKSRRHDYGETLNRAEFPEYFKAMGRNRCLVVNDSFNDPRTSEFRDGYALRHGITSMLDVSVWLHGKVVAVICHEHIGQKREWTGEEQDFAISVADMISLAFETAERKRIETALNKNEARMRQSEKMTALGTLTEGIAHDFNNLLTPIIGYTEVTQKIFAKDSEEYKDLAAVLKPARLAKDIVAQLLQFGRKSGGVAYPINLGDVVSENTKLLKSYLPKSVLLHTSIEKGIKNIMSEVSSIQQVLMNLCINAAQAMPNGGMLKIAVSNSEIAVENPETGSPDTEMNVLLEVSDTGTGMEKHVLDRIFEPFFTTKSVGEGTGLGLSLVFGIVQQAGGDIAVESEVGKGTTFRLTFPAIANCENKKTESIKKDISGKETILVVDDEASIVEMCKKALEASGYKVFGFTDPAKALESFMENPEKYDLVICDQNMPKMKGTQFLSEISASRNNLPSILFTGSIIGIEDTERGSIRISEIARKPIGLQEMGMLVRKTIDNAVKEKNRTHSAEKSGIKKRSEDKAYVEGEKKSRLQLESRDDKDVVTITGNIALNTSEKASLLNLYANAKKSGKNIVVNGSSELCKALIDDGFDKFVSLLVTESREQMK
ncbi:MAG: PAS domain S-box protein, partial [Nitrospinota bacterium]|nr:PAS domain S-box protein [Nitrospinota bacterium]